MEIIEQVHFTHKFWIIVLPCILMVIDVLTGYINAKIKHEDKSSVMRQGLGHKVGELAYIVVGVLIGEAFNFKMIPNFISIYIIVMELLSILENCERLGIKPPKKIKEGLEEIKESEDDGNQGKSN